MTPLLEQAFREAARLSEEEQDALAAHLLDELAFERNWDDLFSGAADLLGPRESAPVVARRASPRR